MLVDIPLNEDMNMRLQYLAGMGLNTSIAPQVYREILTYRKFPDDLMIGSGEGLSELRESIGRPHRTF
jgi:spermidine synthase